MTQPTVQLSAGLAEKFQLFETAYAKGEKKICDNLQASIENLGPKLKTEVYFRFAKAYQTGVKESVDGEALFKKNFNFSKLQEAYLEVIDDVATLNELKTLFAAKAPISNMVNVSQKFSLTAKELLAKQIPARGATQENWTNLPKIFKWNDEAFVATAPKSTKTAKTQEKEPSTQAVKGKKKQSQDPVTKPQEKAEVPESKDKKKHAQDTNQKSQNKPEETESKDKKKQEQKQQ